MNRININCVRQGRLMLVCLLSVQGAWCAEAFQQDGGSKGIVAIEAEHFTARKSQAGHTWSAAYPAGHSGPGALEATPNSGLNVNQGFIGSSPRVDYRIRFVKSGIHYLWVRGLGVSDADNSVHAGLNGVSFATSNRFGPIPRQLSWYNRQMGGAVMIDVPSPGEHTLNLWMREDGVVVDKLVLTTSRSYVPGGVGPVSSVKAETTAAAVASALPADLRGVAPQQAVVALSAVKPSGATTATVTLSTFDADFSDEGELTINGNTPIQLFGESASPANDDQNVRIAFTTPAAHWRNGANQLVFLHKRTQGFSIDDVGVTFSTTGTGTGTGTGSGETATTPAVSGGGVSSGQINLTGLAPEEGSLNIELSKPASASTALLSLRTYDADRASEGALIINGNPPVALFGSAAAASNDRNTANVVLETPAAYWRNGQNTLLFQHLAYSGGFTVESLSVAFASAAMAAPAGNTAPTLSGSPPGSATVGKTYVFQPTAADANGDVLKFTIRNKPAWASFNTSTGRLWGVPAGGDVGSYANIKMVVSDPGASTGLPSFTITVADTNTGGGEPAAGSPSGSLSLRWQAPVTRENGAGLKVSDIAGYTLYYGTAPGKYDDSLWVNGGATTSISFNDLKPGEVFYLALTSTDQQGAESTFSNEVRAVVN